MSVCLFDRNKKTVEFSGAQVTPSDYPISMASGWNWIGYIQSSSLDLNTALTFNAEADDFIKSQSAFATYYAGYGWFGQLASLEPFNAYLLNLAFLHLYH